MARPPRTTPRDPRILGAALGLVAGCFTGADALHLPCERDEDCGKGQSCVVVPGAPTGFCDGPPDSEGPPTSTSVADTSSGSSTASEEDSGSSSGEPPIPVCGNGVREGDEVCDTGLDDGDCNSRSGCDQAGCCQPNVCGDGYVNPATEMCEGESEDCRGCLPVLLSLGPTSGQKAWDVVTAGPPAGLSELLPDMTGGWTGWRYQSQRLEIGSYPAMGQGGAAYATTPVLDLQAPTPPDVFYQLRIVHEYAFDGGAIEGCQSVPDFYDGGQVQVLAMGSDAAQTLANPQPPYPGVLVASPGDDPTCNGLQDAREVAAFRGSVAEPITTTFDLSDFATQQIEAMFVARFNCEGNCWSTPPADPGWKISELEVAAVRR